MQNGYSSSNYYTQMGLLNLAWCILSYDIQPENITNTFLSKYPS
jgi:hypothetical protein